MAQHEKYGVAAAVERHGIARGASPILSHAEHLDLESLVDRLFVEDGVQATGSKRAASILCIVGKHPRLDELADKVLLHAEVREVLTAIAGPAYKLWTISARYSWPGDPGLAMHQDAWGQLNLTLRVGPRPTRGGATAAFRGSHLLPRWSPARSPQSQRTMDAPPALRAVSWSAPRLARWVAHPLRLEDTDAGFLINKTWHMRGPNRSHHTNKVLLFGFFAPGGCYAPVIDHARIATSHRELARRSDTSGGVRPLAAGLVEVLPGSAHDPTPFVTEIEGITSLKARNALPFGKYALLEAGTYPVRRCRELARFFASGASAGRSGR